MRLHSGVGHWLERRVLDIESVAQGMEQCIEYYRERIDAMD